MNEQSRAVKVAERHTADEVEITFRKTAGDEKCRCKIEANNAAAALNGVCIIVQEYARVLQLPAMHVLAVIAAAMAEPKEGGEAE